MKKIIYIFVLVLFILTSCEKNELDNNLQNSNIATVVDNINRPTRPIILGKRLNNPFSIENMQAALDSLKAHTDQLEGCMKAPNLINEIVVSTTDLYIRLLPENDMQYRTLMNDKTLTLFDFPLDYNIEQNGDYYHDPTVTGNYTWLYTRVAKDYQPPKDIKYEVISELFLYEHSPYYTEEVLSTDGSMKAKNKYDINLKDALKTIQAIAFFNTGNKYGSIESLNTNTGMQKMQKTIKKTFLGKIWYDYEYYPSGTFTIESTHAIDKYGVVSRYDQNTGNYLIVPLKGIKVFFWNWFKWTSIYTDLDGKYLSDKYFDGDPEYYIYFSGRNGNNSWDLERQFIGLDLWVQKHSLGEQSKNGFNTTIKSDNDYWDACLANNMIYEYMTICDREGLTRPSSNLKVALSAHGGGLRGAPLLQNHTNFYSTAIIAGLAFTMSPLYRTSLALMAAAPDIVISSGWVTGSYPISGMPYLYRSIWHELTHASNYRCVESQKGYWYASDYWSSVIGSEIVLKDNYGSKGDNNWEQIALVEGWAFYNEKRYDAYYLNGVAYNGYNDIYYPQRYIDMFFNLNLIGCSNSNLEKCLSAKTLADYRNLLIGLYPSLSTQITEKIQEYE